MKKYILAASFVLSTAFAAEIPTEQLGNWTETFNTKVGQIQHTPDSTQMGFITTGEGIKMNCPAINGVKLTAPLDLTTNSTRAQFVAAMKVAGIYTGN